MIRDEVRYTVEIKRSADVRHIADDQVGQDFMAVRDGDIGCVRQQETG